MSDLSTILVPEGAMLLNSGSSAYIYQTDLSVDAVAKFYQSMPLATAIILCNSHLNATINVVHRPD